MGRSRLGNSPESIHQPSRTIGKFVGKPPLRPKGSVSAARKPLEVGDPVVRPKCRLAVGFVSSLRKVQRLNRGKPGSVAVTALVRFITAEFDTIPLLSGHGGAMHNVLGPFGCGLNPLDKPPCMFTPLRIFFRMK